VEEAENGLLGCGKRFGLENLRKSIHTMNDVICVLFWLLFILWLQGYTMVAIIPGTTAFSIPVQWSTNPPPPPPTPTPSPVV
jgi:hypothetical protein